MGLGLQYYAAEYSFTLQDTEVLLGGMEIRATEPIIHFSHYSGTNSHSRIGFSFKPINESRLLPSPVWEERHVVATVRTTTDRLVVNSERNIKKIILSLICYSFVLDLWPFWKSISPTTGYYLVGVFMVIYRPLRLLCCQRVSAGWSMAQSRWLVRGDTRRPRMFKLSSRLPQFVIRE